MTDRQAADAEIIGLAGEITYASEIGVDEDLDEALAALRVAHAAPVPPGLSRDPRVDWTAVEHLVDDAIRREVITAARGAEILGLRLQTWRDRALEIRDAGNPLASPSPEPETPE